MRQRAMFAEPIGRHKGENKLHILQKGLQKFAGFFGSNSPSATRGAHSTSNWMDEAPEWLLDDIGISKGKMHLAHPPHERTRKQKALRQAYRRTLRRMW